MPEPRITYIAPTWGLIPLQDHTSSAVHVKIEFDEDSTLPVEITHNFNLPYGPSLQPPEWVGADYRGEPALQAARRLRCPR